MAYVGAYLPNLIRGRLSSEPTMITACGQPSAVTFENDTTLMKVFTVTCPTFQVTTPALSTSPGQVYPVPAARESAFKCVRPELLRRAASLPADPTTWPKGRVVAASGRPQIRVEVFLYSLSPLLPCLYQLLPSLLTDPFRSPGLEDFPTNLYYPTANCTCQPAQLACCSPFPSPIRRST